MQKRKFLQYKEMMKGLTTNFKNLDPRDQRAAKMIDDLYHKNKKLRERKASGKIGRNEPCPCESGKKYKKCCMK